MKKRFLSLLIIMIFSVFGIIGCSDEEDYKSDIKEVKAMYAELTVFEDSGDFTEAVDNLNMCTSEGKDIKKDMKEVTKLLEKAEKYKEKNNEEKLAEIVLKAEEVLRRLEETTIEFQMAAMEEGVSSEDIAILDDLKELTTLE